MVKSQKKKALWVSIYKDQAKKLRPEKDEFRAGITSRSSSHEIKMAVYRAIRLLYLSRHPDCECCPLVQRYEVHYRPQLATTIHHTKGKDGWLLVDVRYFKACCLTCHSWIDAHRDEARKLGLLAKQGNWNKIT